MAMRPRRRDSDDQDYEAGRTSRKVLDAMDGSGGSRRTKRVEGNPYTGRDNPAARNPAPPRRQRGNALNDDDAQNMIERMVEDARNYAQDELAPIRERAWRYYNRNVDAKPKKGRSGAVDAVVRDTVDGVLPQLIRVFASSQVIGRYTPVQPEDQDAADAATMFADYVFKKQNQGFRQLHDHVKDGLVGGVGVFRTYCSHSKETTEARYEGLSPDEFTLLLSDDGDDTEVVEVAQRIELVELPVQPPPPPPPPPQPPMAPPGPSPGLPAPPQPGMPQQPPPPPQPPQMPPPSNVIPFNPGALTAPRPMTVIDCTIRTTRTVKRIVIDGVDPAEFIIDPRATSEDDARCIGMDANRPASEVIAMGIDPDVVEEIATAPNDDDRTGEKAARNPRTSSTTTDTTSDEPWMDRSIRVVDVIVRIDQDGDGIPERRHVIALGEEFKIVRNEPTDECPYAIGSPILMPHSSVGQGVAELVDDVQDIQTAILRQQLDSLYQAVNPRTVAVENQVNLQDLVDNQFNGVIRTRAPGMVQPYNVEFVGQQAFPMVERMDQIRENRTGLSRAAQGLQADALQSSTEVGVRAVIGAALMKIELLARVYAETSIKRLFRQILFLAVRYQTEPLTIEHDGQPLTVDPRSWKADMQFNVDVGLGTGNEDERKQTLMMVLQTQREALMQMGPMNPLCDLANYYNTLADMLALSPYKDASRYFKQPTQQAMQQFMQQQAEAAKKKDDSGSAQAKMADVQRKAQEGQAKLQLQSQQGQQKLQLQAQEGQQKLQLQAQIAQAQMQLEQLKALQQAQLERETASIEMQTDITELEAEALLEKYKIDQQVKVDTRLQKQTPDKGGGK